MSRRIFSLFVLTLTVFGLFASTLVLQAQDDSHRGRKFKALPPNARIEVTVVRDVNGKPIEHAAVIFHLVGDKGNMELKTNDEGKAVIDVLPVGCQVTLQIIAKGFQTYGGDYKIDKPNHAIEIRMKRPGEQYSIYKDHPENDAKPADGVAKPASGSAPAQPK